MKKILFIFLSLFSIFVFSQERHLSGIIQNDIIFYSDTTYIIDYNIRLNDESTLTVFEGSRIVFESGSSFIIDGSLKMNGTSENPIFIYSNEEDYQGFGFIFSGHLGGDIILQNCIFEKLLVPISFKYEWFRTKVLIENCIFRDINSQQSSININSLNQIHSTSCDFLFKRNKFVNNNSTIYIEPLEDDALKLEFSENLFSNNVMIGRNELNPLNAVLSGNFDQLNKRNQLIFKDNSFVNNIYISVDDTIIMKDINFGITGTANQFEIKGNYFGEENTTSERLIHFYQNNNLPLVSISNPQTFPYDEVPLHVYKVDFNNQSFYSFNKDINLDNNENTLVLYVNKKIDNINLENIEYVFFDNNLNTFQKELMSLSDYNIKDNIISLYFISSEGVIKNPDGVFVIPSFNVGSDTSESFLFGNSSLLYLDKYDLLSEYINKSEDNKNIKPQKEEIVIPEKELRSSYGFSMGLMMFSGDVEMKEATNCFSMNYSYPLSKNWKMQFSVLNGELSGENSIDGSDNFKFKSEIIEFQTQFCHDFSEINVLNLTPFISSGVSLFHFDPQAEYENYTYHLSELKTENQIDAYSLVSLAIPYSFGVKYNYKDLEIFAISSFRYTFTDYIDDVSGSYANYNEMLSDRGEVSSYFSNPDYKISGEQRTGFRGNPFDNDSFYYFSFGINKLIK